MEPDVATAMQRRVEELQRLADSIAEHHPYWPLLHFTLQLLSRIVEKWHQDLTQEDLDEMAWLAEKIQEQIQRLNSRG
jgi:hypothetical protein